MDAWVVSTLVVTDSTAKNSLFMCVGISVGHISEMGLFCRGVNAFTVFMDVCSWSLHLLSWEGPGHIQTSTWKLISLEPPATSKRIHLNREHVTRAQSWCSILEHPKVGVTIFLDFLSLASQRWCICSLLLSMVLMRALKSELSFPICQRLFDCHRFGGDTQGKWCMTELQKLWFRTGALDSDHLGLDFWLHLFLTLWPWASV